MPSLYETTAAVGDVESSNFTTLYNASGLTVPNAGAGTVSGNLNVGGNLTVQGTSLLQGAVTLGSTLCLPNYCFPIPDGSTDQVLTTDGSGNLYWASVTSLPGANYTIQADTATGGANLSLVSTLATDSVKFASGTNAQVVRTDANTITINSANFAIQADTATGGANLTLTNSLGSPDSVKLAAGTNMSIVRTDANTITIGTVADNIPDGTAKGQLLVWDGTAWTANNQVISDTSTGRFTPIYKNSSAGVNNIIFARKDYGASTYTTGDGAGLAFQLDSNTQAENTIGVINTAWNATAPIITLATNINNNTGGPFVTVGSFTSAQATVPGDLAVNGGDITTTQTTGNLFNTTATTVNIGNAATTEVNLGNTTSGRVQIKSPTIVGANTTQNVFNTVATTVNAFGASTATNIGASTGTTTIGHDLTVNGIYSQTGETMTINSDNTAADSYVYLKGSTQYLKWDNTNTQFEFSDPLFITDTSPPSLFERQVTAGAQSPNELKTSTNLILRVTDAASNATDDGGPAVKFSRTSGVSGGSTVDYGIFGAVYYGTTNTAGFNLAWSDDNFTETSPGVFPGTYTLQTWQPTYSEFFNSSLYVDYTTNGAAQVGVNTNTPAYTLDVNGDAHVATDLTVDGDVSIDGVNINLTAPAQAGQVLTYNGTDIVNSSLIQWTNTTYRPVFEGKTGVYGRTQAGATVSQNTGANNYTTADGTSLLMRLDSDAQSPTTFGSVSTQYNTTGNHQIRLATATNNFSYDLATSITGGNTLVFSAAHGFAANERIFYAGNTTNGLTINTPYYVLATGLTTTQCQISLTQGGSAVSLTNGTGLNLYFLADSERLLAIDQTAAYFTPANITLNAYNTGIAATDAQITVERGTTGADAFIKWEEANDFWRMSNDLYVDGVAIGGTALATNGNNIWFNYDDVSAADSYLTVKRGASADVSIRWNEGTQRWQDTTDGSTYYNLPNQNLDTTSDVNFSSVIVDNLATFNTQTTTTTSTALTTISATTRKAQKVVINIVDNVTNEIHILEALAVRKGVSAAYLTTYAEMYSNTALATFTADAVTISGSDYIRIRATPASANSTTFTVARISLD